MQQSTLHRTKLQDFLLGQSGRFVRVDFTKKGGEARVMVGRLGVRNRLRGGKNNVVGENNSYITLFDTQADEYRTVNLSTVSAVKANKCLYEILDDVVPM